MKFELNLLRFGGGPRTSTVVLIVAFLVLWWTYETYRPQPEPARSNTPPSQVVPPGFVPDPNYTWVPRTRVPQQPTTQAPMTTPPANQQPAPSSEPGTTTSQEPGSTPRAN